MSWQEPWIWVVAGVLLGALEMLLPGFILLGFAVGAILVGGLLWIGVIGDSLPLAVLVLALSALAVWLVMRKLMGVHPGQTRIWDRDINEN
ncbi:hypothetical protein C8J27_10524 [Rhodobacter aestuarii]|uniref:NfeD-like C-terminal, partner-binding n=1 Tax=Rhodobacter aestuarii TaxID=453582 RepID=A0A1N7LR55_9RHOB|nr:hypothetical protein [Rhodobacter aestuarii]PTV95082.1 hypothetical protein C8J27_10524 [Rhodobacter aestuarii]SIS76316.1 hypothetical protein SAMN05421580_104252 [Rhodobacter aestuarii]